ncbi:TPA: hypothetical protein N0F65_004651 [Lagenidium giganteum]|uniref:Uncharacterized protein n=1 Tax=Lagenidium giganteum TaxID=4803 RepID=A0AAV2ZDK6_9STRA|nr:TPA: hypothetical protein N0F65_004651 [Lagenidium giganteum]
MHCLGRSGWGAIRDVDVEAYLDGPYVPVGKGPKYPGLKDSYHGPSAAIAKVPHCPRYAQQFFIFCKVPMLY